MSHFKVWLKKKKDDSFEIFALSNKFHIEIAQILLYSSSVHLDNHHSVKMQRIFTPPHQIPLLTNPPPAPLQCTLF